jgi:CO dehydrogenase/acetyl-CoA synthase gamma subunit (corrinoid Fe-S protein)
VDPGLYAVGQPDQQAPVLVTANYKLSLDALRSELTGLNAWILVSEKPRAGHAADQFHTEGADDPHSDGNQCRPQMRRLRAQL